MSKYPQVPPSLLNKFTDIAKDLAVHAVLIDRFGVIVAVNDQWKRFADLYGLTLPDYGVGENYLRHCAFVDPLSPRLVKGLSQLISGELDCLSIVYSCDAEIEPAWFLLFGFPHPDHPDHVVLMHIDVSVLVAAMLRDQRQASASAEPGEQPAAFAGDHAGPTTATVEQAILSALAEGGHAAQRFGGSGGPPSAKEGRQSPLSKRQRDVLALMAKGMTNAEIAETLGLSLNTVKVYVSGILTRLGLQSRAQVLHWAFSRKTTEES